MRKTLFLFLSLSVVLSLFFSTAAAHPGKTDSKGGHYVSATGEYHYHCGGHSAHQHPNGVCPYSSSKTNTATATNTNSKTVSTAKSSSDGYNYTPLLIFFGSCGGLFLAFKAAKFFSSPSATAAPVNSIQHSSAPAPVRSTPPAPVESQIVTPTPNPEELLLSLRTKYDALQSKHDLLQSEHAEYKESVSNFLYALDRAMLLRYGCDYYAPLFKAPRDHYLTMDLKPTSGSEHDVYQFKAIQTATGQYVYHRPDCLAVLSETSISLDDDNFLISVNALDIAHSSDNYRPCPFCHPVQPNLEWVEKSLTYLDYLSYYCPKAMTTKRFYLK